MTPKQEVSKFLCNRAIFLRDIGRYQEATRALDAAERFNPLNPACADIRFTLPNPINVRSLASPLGESVLISNALRFAATSTLVLSGLPRKEFT